MEKEHRTSYIGLSSSCVAASNSNEDSELEQPHVNSDPRSH
jgi:hypothetical protein